MSSKYKIKSKRYEDDDDDDSEDDSLYSNFVADDDDDDDDEDGEIEEGEDDDDENGVPKLDGDLDDEELRQAFAKGLLKGPLVDLRRPKINNESRLHERLDEIKQTVDENFTWVERVDYTSAEPVVVEDAQDDFKREMSFYNQALEAAKEARKKLESMGVKVTRPQDYFAEMVKTDDHMRKIRETLLSEHKSVERSEQAKKTRQMKKLGKKVQQQILEERSKQKAEDLEAIKKFKKDRSAKPDFLDDADDQFNVSIDKSNDIRQKRKASENGGANAKKARKDAKFGSGGRKRGMKRNTASSASDDSGFNLAKNRALPKGMKSTGSKKNVRLGKSRRQQNKNRSRN